MTSTENLWVSPAAAAVWIATLDIERVLRLQRPISKRDDDPHGNQEATALQLMAMQQIADTAPRLFPNRVSHEAVGTEGFFVDIRHAVALGRASDKEGRAVRDAELRYPRAMEAVRRGYMAGWHARGSRTPGGPSEEIHPAERRQHKLDSLNAHLSGRVVWHDVALRFADIVVEFPAAAVDHGNDVAAVSAPIASSSHSSSARVSRARLCEWMKTEWPRLLVIRSMSAERLRTWKAPRGHSTGCMRTRTSLA
jgi:hypothetical protein